MNKITIALADDHQLFLKSLAMMLEAFGNYDIVAEGLNGQELLDKIDTLQKPPQLVLLDVNMPVLNGVATARQLVCRYPHTKVVALSMNDNDNIIIDMIKAGCCAYLLKDMHPDELETALHEIVANGYYNADVSNVHFRRLLELEKKNTQFTEKELTFLQLACTDQTYKMIAAKMNLTERMVDAMREQLFGKMRVQSRVGMALEAVRRGLVTI